MASSKSSGVNQTFKEARSARIASSFKTALGSKAAREYLDAKAVEVFKDALKGMGLKNIPQRKMSFTELKSWFQSQISNPKTELLKVLKDPRNLDNLGKVMKAEGVGGKHYDDLMKRWIGKDERGLPVVQYQRTRLEWKKELDKPSWSSTSNRPGSGNAAGGMVSKVHRQILNRNKKVTAWAMSSQGRGAIHQSVLRETGSYHKAIEAVRFLEGEAMRRAEGISRSARGGGEVDIRESTANQRGVFTGGNTAKQGSKLRRDLPSYRRVEEILVRRLRRGDTTAFNSAVNLDYARVPGREGNFLPTEAGLKWRPGRQGDFLKDQMVKAGLANEYHAMKVRIAQEVERFINTGPTGALKKIAPVPNVEAKAFAKEYARRVRSGVLTAKGTVGDNYREGEFLKEWNRKYGKKDPGNVRLTFGKFKGKSLREVFDTKPYYVAGFLDSYSSGTSAKGTENRVDLAINAFMQTAVVKKYIDDYNEEADGASPRDMQPYFDKRTGKGAKTKGGGYYGKNWVGEGQLSWRDPGVWRKGGFAVSDSHEGESKLLMGRGRVTQAAWDPEARDGRGAWVPGAGPLVWQQGGDNMKMEFMQNWKYRKKEYRWDDPSRSGVDMGEYAQSLNRKETMDVIGRHYSTYKEKGGALERFKKAAELSPYMMTGFYERLIRFDENAHKFFRDKDLRMMGAGEGMSFGEEIDQAMDRKMLGRKASLRRGVDDPNQPGAYSELDLGFLNVSTLRKLGKEGTREQLLNWRSDFGEQVGFDVANFYKNMYGDKYDVEGEFLRAWNKVSAR